MTAEDFANLVQARSAGRNRWLARCPAHDDRSPSLAITQGDRGVLVRCWSNGCTVEAICAALGMPMRSLFADSLPPEQCREVRLQAEAKNAAVQKAKVADRKLIAQLWQLREWIRQASAALAVNPAHATLGKELHDAFERYAKLEAQLYPTPEDGPQPQQPTPETPQWIDRELKAVFPKADTSDVQHIA